MKCPYCHKQKPKRYCDTPSCVQKHKELYPNQIPSWIDEQ